MIARRRNGIYGKWRLQCNPACVPITQVCRTTVTTGSKQRASHSLFSNGFPKTEPTCRPYLLEDSPQEDYFRFTRDRFVSDEQHEMSQRYVRFNLAELARYAAKAVGSESCIGVEKYPDGMYKKAFLLTMDDGAQVVAKVPNPNAGRPHFTTASEVATVEFVYLVHSFVSAELNLNRSGRSLELPSQKFMHGAPELKTPLWVLSISSWRRLRASN